MILVVMGVSGSGKSTLGLALSRALGWDFIEGDDHHPQANIEKMRAGHPLDEDDRRPWIDRLHQLLDHAAAADRDTVLACSALKKSHRESLSRGLPDIRFVFLCGDPQIIRERLQARTRHFMPPDLLDSQIAALEPPRDAVLVPVRLTTAEQVDRVRRAIDLGDTR